MIKYSTYVLVIPLLFVFGNLSRIQKALEKKEYEKAYELILKGYNKEPENPGLYYYHSWLSFDQSFSAYDLDSARILIESAKLKFDSASVELKEDLINDGITRDTIEFLHNQIRDRAYKNTLNSLTIKSANDFLLQFPNSIYEGPLNYKIDSINYHNAVQANDASSFEQFISNNPSSVFISRADSILDDLRYQALVEVDDLESYYYFHQSYPNSRHKEKVESFILKFSTPGHSEEEYTKFFQLVSSKALQKKAADLMYYLSEDTYKIHPRQDSIRKVRSMSQVSLIPFIENEKYGFFDADGETKINPEYQQVFDEYKCGSTNDGWIYVKNEDNGLVLTKNGEVVLTNVDGYRSVSKDLGLIKHGDALYMYHKSGFKILERPVQDAEIIGKKWIKVKIDDKWGLFSFLGLPVAEVIYDDIYLLASFWIFEKNNRIAVYTQDLILDEIKDRGVSLEFKFDDIELVDDNTLIGFNGERECLLDSTLGFKIPWGNYEIYPEESGWYLKSNQGYRLYNTSEADIMDRHYPYLESNGGWLALQTDEDWMLLPRRGDLLPSRSYDSIKLINEHAALLIKDGKRTLQFSSGTEIPLTDQRIQTLQDQKRYIALFQKGNSLILDEEGQEVISGKFENPTFLNDTLIRVQKRVNQGLMNTRGDWVLNPLFDSIDEKDGLMLTLIDGNIGCYDPKINKIITTEYEARIERIRDYYLAKKDGKYGVIDHTKAEILPFLYDEIRIWNDTSYIVKSEEEYLIINEDAEEVFETMESIELLVENDLHKIMLYVKDGKYGLLSTEFGELLDPEFTEIQNIGSIEKPIIFADQHLKKAGFHVVSYVDEKGKLITSKAYTRNEFDKVLCDE